MFLFVKRVFFLKIATLLLVGHYLVDIKAKTSLENSWQSIAHTTQCIYRCESVERFYYMGKIMDADDFDSCKLLQIPES